MEVRKNRLAKAVYVTVMAVTLLIMFFVMPVKVAKAETEYDEAKGYIKLSSYTSRLNVREKATTKSVILGKLYAGDVVNIVNETEDFYKIKYNFESKVTYAYVHKNYVVIPELGDNEKELMSSAVITADSSSKNRNYNMQLACEKIDGLVLKPGEQFDWYGKNGVGQANKANGFKESTVIQGGKYVKGYGGGVCQVSTALYNAIYDLEIEPDELHHHSIPSSYVEYGMDATVAYGYKNFVFTNTKDYAIEIKAFTEGSQVTILIYKVQAEVEEQE